MNYVIIEQQTVNGATTVVTPIEARSDYFAAVSVWHAKCAIAAISAMPRHAVTLLNERGDKVKYECFDHESSETEE